MNKNIKLELEPFINKKIIYFKHNGEIYRLKTSVSISYIEFFQDNKDKMPKKELALQCIRISNESFKSVLKDLKRGQIIYILNQYIIINKMSECKITTYDEFCIVMESYIDKCLTGIKESLDKFSKQISENLESIAEVGNIISSAITPQIELFKNIVIPKFDFSKVIEKMYEPIKNISEQFRNMDIFKYISEWDKMLIELGYPPVDFDIPEIRYIVDNKGNENICEVIDSLIIEKYDDEYMDEIINGWSKYDFLSNRINLFNDAIYAHKIEKYSLSIPLLLSQLEGTVSEFFNVKGKSKMKSYKGYVEDILEKNKITHDKKILKAYFMNFVLENFVYGDKIPKFSRHAILHGADIDFGTKINSINLIITLNIIFECINDIKKSEK